MKMPERESGRYESSALKPVVRRLLEPERRILIWGLIRERRRMAKTAPLVTLLTGLVIFGSLWGLSILARRADNSGPSWRASGLIWLALESRFLSGRTATSGSSLPPAMEVSRAH